jgi:hypothetical protein
MFRPDQTMQRVERPVLLAAQQIAWTALESVKEISSGAVVVDADLDLAAIPVDASLERQHPVRFFNVDVGGTTPGEGHRVVVQGYPHDISRVIQQGERAMFASTEWTSIEPNRAALAGFDPALHFLFDYPSAQDYPDAHPRGFSGGGVWFQRPPKNTLWHPDLDVAGVTIAYYSRPRLLKAVRREVVEHFLARIG